MKEKNLLAIYIFLVLLIIPLGIYFLSLRQHPQKKTAIQPSPSVTSTPTVIPSINKPVPTPTASVIKEQYFQALLAKLPITGTIITTNDLSVDYTITHSEGDPSNTITIDMTNINFQVSQNGQAACEKNLQVVSTDQQNLQYWCDYNYNKTNFQFIAQHIFTTYLPTGTQAPDYNFLWGNRDYIQKQATIWMKELP